jgi:DNA-directed RNA polymerase beta' subunit
MAAALVAGGGALLERYYTTEDETERQLLQEVFQKAIELDGEKREDQAVRIIEELGKRLKGKRGRGRS